MNFCPQCGTRFEPEACFCQECGFDRNSVITKSEIKPEPVVVPPVVESAPFPPANPVILPKTTESASISAYHSNKPAKPIEPPKHLKGKKLWIWIVLILCVTGAASWFVYDLYFSSDKKSPTDMASNIIISENSKPVSLIDQELAKQKEKGQNSGTSQKSTNDKAVEANEASANDIISEVILEVGRKEESNNKNPKNPTKLTLQKPTMITRITTDHYNDGMGTPRGGKITILDSDDNVIGSYKAFGKTGVNGTPGAKWIAEPNIMIQKGTYFISDSDPATWSKTFLGGNGFVVVEGYEVE
jgi:hypothetical protein